MWNRFSAHAQVINTHAITVTVQSETCWFAASASSVLKYLKITSLDNNICLKMENNCNFCPLKRTAEEANECIYLNLINKSHVPGSCWLPHADRVSFQKFFSCCHTQHVWKWCTDVCLPLLHTERGSVSLESESEQKVSVGWAFSMLNRSLLWW